MGGEFLGVFVGGGVMHTRSLVEANPGDVVDHVEMPYLPL